MTNLFGPPINHRIKSLYHFHFYLSGWITPENKELYLSNSINIDVLISEVCWYVLNYSLSEHNFEILVDRLMNIPISTANNMNLVWPIIVNRNFIQLKWNSTAAVSNNWIETGKLNIQFGILRTNNDGKKT